MVPEQVLACLVGLGRGLALVGSRSHSGLLDGSRSGSRSACGSRAGMGSGGGGGRVRL